MLGKPSSHIIKLKSKSNEVHSIAIQSSKSQHSQSTINFFSTSSNFRLDISKDFNVPNSNPKSNQVMFLLDLALVDSSLSYWDILSGCVVPRHHEVDGQRPCSHEQRGSEPQANHQQPGLHILVILSLHRIQQSGRQVREDHSNR